MKTGIVAKEKNKNVKKVERYRWIVWTALAAVYVFVTFSTYGGGSC